MIASEPDRVEQMRTGHADLVRTTGQDFGYDLAKWREFLLKHDKEFGYRHPYAFASVDRAVKAATADPEFTRLAALAAAGGRDWDAKYNEKLARECSAGRKPRRRLANRSGHGRTVLCHNLFLYLFPP